VQTSGVHSNTGLYRSPVTVTFAISDDFGAGVTAYQLDNAPAWTDREYYYPPVVITDDGVHTLAYQPTDRLHNREAPQTTQIRIDRTPPQAEVLAVDGNQLLNGWYNTPVQVTFTGSDALSGLAGFAQQATDATWVASPALTTLATTGDHALTWRAVDNAGNVSTAQQTTVQVDVTPPTTTATLDALPVNGWYTRPVTVTLNAVDVGAGVFQTQYRLNGEAGWRSYSGPFPVNQTGSQTVVYQSTDRALNTEITHTLTLPLDLAAPHVGCRGQSSAGQRRLVWHADYGDGAGQRCASGRGGDRIRAGQQRLATVHDTAAPGDRCVAHGAFSRNRSSGACGDERPVSAGHRHPATDNHCATQHLAERGGLVWRSGHGHVDEHRHPDWHLAHLLMTNPTSPPSRCGWGRIPSLSLLSTALVYWHSTPTRSLCAALRCSCR